MRKISAQLLLASLVLSTVVVVVAVLTTAALVRSGHLTAALGERQLQTLEQTEQLEDLLFQKGFLANYLATGAPKWLAELAVRKRTTREWLEKVQRDADTDEERTLAYRLRDAYLDYDAARERALAAYHDGRREEAVALFDTTHAAINRVLEVAHALAQASRHDLVATLSQSERALDGARSWIVALAMAAAIAGIAFGVGSGRRIARPIYELIVRVENADPERVRLSTGDGGDELATLSAHVTNLVERLAEQRRRLVQAEKMEAVGEITAKLAHEILNPVAGVKAALQVEMRTQALPPSTRLVLAQADLALSHLDGIMARLVRFARPLEPRRRPTAVAAVVETTLAACAHELSSRGVTAKAELAKLPVADLDPDLVEQLLTNLVLNAAQASPAGATVTVRALARSRRLVLEVTDQGHGLPQTRERLFRLYFTTREKGHGLGLAVCRNIVAEHGGTIEAADGPGGVGARFTVTLPQTEASWENPS